MAIPSDDYVTIHIKQRLAQFSRSYAPAEHCIFKVSDQLHNENKSAYEPKIVSIGPYHHGKENLKEMELHKLRYLQLLLERRNESSLNRYIVVMRELEEEARKCYAEPINLSSDAFLEMMLLDGCFIIELFLKFRSFNPDDLTLRRIEILHDLMLLENQLPFFILQKLLDMMTDSNKSISIIDIALHFLRPILPGPINFERNLNYNVNHFNHLLGLMHSVMRDSYTERVSQRDVVMNWQFIKCTTELREAGIKFEAKERTSLLDIQVRNEVIEIPTLDVYDNTELLFRNLIAYEQCFPNDRRLHSVNDYIAFMVCLINSAEDVEELCRSGIIKNGLHNNEVVATMFNKLGNLIRIDSASFLYIAAFNEVNHRYDQCGIWTTKLRRHRNIWMAKLRREYYKRPWYIISFLTAFVLLLLTLTQTIFSILAYVK